MLVEGQSGKWDDMLRVAEPLCKTATSNRTKMVLQSKNKKAIIDLSALEFQALSNI